MLDLLNERLAREQRISKYGVNYGPVLNRPICEVNEAFAKWDDKIGHIPGLGVFLEIENTGNSLKTWCIVIGSFNDADHPNRVLVVSQVVSEALFFKKWGEILPARVRLMDETEWKANKDCVDLLEVVLESE